MNKNKGMIARIIARGGIVVYFIMAFEVMIMISPFAFFFYSVFNPVFNWFGQFAVTRWLTSFFLPHMILPPTIFLKTVRITGSVLFVLGSLSFIICALQVYMGKIFKWGVADKGLYSFIRHPQYLALAVWGIAMSILWPRFIVLVTLSIMFVLYYFLAKDEERRMLSQYGESYTKYMEKTGMFFPKFIDKWFRPVDRLVPNKIIRDVCVSVLLVILTIGAGFGLYGITINSIPVDTRNNFSLVSMLPEDMKLIPVIADGIEKNLNDGKLVQMDKNKAYLGYVMPVDYIMQGMIADTSENYHLFKQHHTISLINDWILHPFRHLRSSPVLNMAKMNHVDPKIARRHHCPLGINDSSLDCGNCPYRRIIFTEVQNTGIGHIQGKDLLGYNTIKTPAFYADIDTRTGEFVNLKSVKKDTAWQNVPTPAY